MITFLFKIFIKNPDDVQNPEVRGLYGILCGAAGIFFNILLCTLKLMAGIFSKSVAVTADAFNNLSDAAASIVTILGFKLSGKKPDAEHPFGHGRLEYIAGLAISFFILMMGIELLKGSVLAVIHPEPVDANIISVVILAASILVKFYMYFYNHKVSKKLSSPAMEATAKDSLNDTVSTVVVLASVIAVKLFPQLNLPVDGIAGIFVALFILYSGFSSAKETVNPLLGTPADAEFVRKIEDEVLSHEHVVGIHDLVVHDYGPGRVMVSLHAEVPGDRNIFELHDVIDNAEVAVAKKFGCNVTIHMDPIDLNSSETVELKTLVSCIAEEINPELTIHDLRVVPGQTHTNVIFDVVKPHSCVIEDSELCRQLRERVKEKKSNYECVIQVDRPFV